MVRYLGFQFHKGTIRTQNLSTKYQNYHDFNSIKVQLELQGYQTQVENTHISIP